MSKRFADDDKKRLDDAIRVQRCDEAISEAVDGVICIRFDSYNSELQLAIKLLEINALNGLMYPLPLREEEEEVFQIIADKNIEFSPEFCWNVDEDLESLNRLILHSMGYAKQGFMESAKDCKQIIEGINIAI